MKVDYIVNKVYQINDEELRFIRKIVYDTTADIIAEINEE